MYEKYKDISNLTVVMDKEFATFFKIFMPKAEVLYGYQLLKGELDHMKFDLIVGNPPYSELTIGRKKRKSIWFKFVKKSIELLKEDGYINMTTPASLFSIARFGEDRNNLSFLTSRGFEFTSIMSDVTDQFNVGIKICNWEIHRKNDGKCVVDDVLMDLDYTKPLPFKMSPMNINILHACFTSLESWEFTSGDKSKLTDHTVKIPGGRFPKYKNLSVGLSSDSPHTGKAKTTLVISNPDEVANYESIFSSKLFHYIIDIRGGNDQLSPAGIMRALPRVDTTRSWTDEDLYEEFNLSPEQIAMIEEN